MRSQTVETMDIDQLEQLVSQLSSQARLAETREILLEARAIALRLNHLLETEKKHDAKLRILAAIAALAVVSQTFNGKIEVTPTASSPLSPAPITRVVPTPVTPSANSSDLESAAKELFKDANSLGSRAIGHAEGNYTVSGEKTKLYYGHIDPGNLSWGQRVTNRGFCSDQGRGGADVNNADAGCVERIVSRLDTLVQDFRAAGIPNPTIEEFINAADLWNQASPRMSRNFPHRLAELKKKGQGGTDAIADARTASFYVDGRNTATGLLGICHREGRGVSDWECVRHDQARRADAIAAVLKHENVSGSAVLGAKQQEHPATATSVVPKSQPASAKTSQSNDSIFGFHLNWFGGGGDVQRAPSIAPSEQDILASKIVKYMQSQGYEIARNPGEINLVYIRTHKQATNRWTDKLVIIRFQGSTPKIVNEWQATTMPGETYIKYGRADGAPFIVPGQYKAWQVGIHRSAAEAARGGPGHEALVQTGGDIKVLRDSDKDGVGDTPDAGRFGINLHGTKNQSEFVNNSSAGCLVVGGEGVGMSGIREVMKIVKSDRRYQADKRFVFPATIVESWKL